MGTLSGECETCRTQGAGLHAKLTIGRADSSSEREADRAAELVARDENSGGPPHTPVPIANPQARSEPGIASAPTRVARVLEAPGHPLDHATRAAMERRFGHRFGDVRVHTDAEASASALDIGAQAYSHGTHIAFGPGRYRPETRAGRHLLAHELAHVVHQSGTSHGAIQRKPGPDAPESTETRATTPEDRREFARTAAAFLRRQGEFFSLQPDRDLGEIIGHLNTTANNALAAVRDVPGAAAVAEEVRGAYRDALRAALVARTRERPDQIRTPPTLQELYEQHRDAILAFALPQASADTGADELSAELAAPLPAEPTREQRARHSALASARQRLRIETTQVDIAIDDLFSTRGATTRVPLPEHTTARFSSTIPPALHRGLTNVAGRLIQRALSANTTVMLALDLTAYGGSYDAYRFTRLDLGTLGIEVLIERQGAIGIEGLRNEQRVPLQERFERVGFRRGSGFSQDEFDQVLIGLGEVPEGQLAALSGLRFERRSDDPAHPDAAAHYDQTAHTVRVFDRAFASGLTRMGRGGRVLRFAAFAVVHEVGHAHDLRALRTTAVATEAAQQALLAEFGTGGTGYRIPAQSAPDRARYDELNRALQGATTAERAARARSGARWSQGAAAEVTDELLRQEAQPVFRQAALADGGPAGRQMPTTYPHPESVWQEYFAESYALYQTSPDVLRRMRPNVFRFMEQAFPR